MQKKLNKLIIFGSTSRIGVEYIKTFNDDKYELIFFLVQKRFKKNY